MIKHEEIQTIASNVDEQIKKIDAELNDIGRIDEAIEKDLQSLIDLYLQDIKRVNLDENFIKERYRASLKSKKIEALKKAKDKLEKLRNELSVALQYELVEH